MGTDSSGQATRVVGPLALWEPPFRGELARLGFSESSIRASILAMARLSEWVRGRALSPNELTSEVLADADIRGIGLVVRFLREIGVVPEPDTGSSVTAVALMIVEFRGWLAGERGLSAATVSCYGKQGGVFLEFLPEPLDEALRGLTAGQVTAFMLAHCEGRNRGSAKAMVTALRALLRFLHVAGHVPAGLAGAVPAVAGWRLASLPRGLDATVVARLLAGCDRDTVTGRRDYAILLLLARLGLRGAEVADLELGDIDWRAGEVTVHGKGNRIDKLPLPVDVGEAMAAYVTDGRPRCDARTVFCTVRAPYRRLTPAAIRAIMGYACARAGLDRLGAHRLRHTLATEMLRAGASLPEVGQVLRHRSQLATSIYAKVDDNALRVLARPWPVGGRS